MIDTTFKPYHPAPPIPSRRRRGVLQRSDTTKPRRLEADVYGRGLPPLVPTKTQGVRVGVEDRGRPPKTGGKRRGWVVDERGSLKGEGGGGGGGDAGKVRRGVKFASEGHGKEEEEEEEEGDPIFAFLPKQSACIPVETLFNLLSRHATRVLMVDVRPTSDDDSGMELTAVRFSWRLPNLIEKHELRSILLDAFSKPVKKNKNQQPSSQQQQQRPKSSKQTTSSTTTTMTMEHHPLILKAAQRLQHFLQQASSEPHSPAFELHSLLILLIDTEGHPHGLASALSRLLRGKVGRWIGFLEGGVRRCWDVGPGMCTHLRNTSPSLFGNHDDQKQQEDQEEEEEEEEKFQGENDAPGSPLVYSLLKKRESIFKFLTNPTSQPTHRGLSDPGNAFDDPPCCILSYKTPTTTTTTKNQPAQPFLYLGSTHSSKPKHLLAFNIQTIIRFANPSPNPFPHTLPHPRITYHSYLLPDSPQTKIGKVWREVWEVLEAVRRERGKVLVHCQAGMSRSVSVVVGYLVRYGLSAGDVFATAGWKKKKNGGGGEEEEEDGGWGLREAFEVVFVARPVACPNEGFWGELEHLEVLMRTHQRREHRKKQEEEHQQSKDTRKVGETK
ncbi:hypothetical protein HDV05_006662 [Chytridiales sp. JEL 0842]|nr:hypothetical protein HDV05_006662 [Chytridiales sp. JEL 0842]